MSKTILLEIYEDTDGSLGWTSKSMTPTQSCQVLGLTQVMVDVIKKQLVDSRNGGK